MDERGLMCRARGLELGETQFGTATAGVDAWFALEHDGPWAAKAWEAAAIPEAVRAHVDGWAAATAGARIQLVRRDGWRAAKVQGDTRTLLLASTRQDRACVAEFRWRSIEDVAQIDLHAAMAALREGRMPTGAHAPSHPIALVCTNGKRDRCCAKWGVPIYEALAADPRVNAWQTTHLGGHRYAATLVWLPSGLCHGRVELGDVAELADAIVAGGVGPLPLLRGRTALGAAAQAAEYLWRLDHDLAADADVVVERSEAIGDAWQVWARVRGEANGEPVALAVREVSTGQMAPPSCGKPEAPVMRWERA